MVIQQSPTPEEFVEHVLQDNSLSDEEEDEEEVFSEEAYKSAMATIENFVRQKVDVFLPKHVGNILLLKEAWEHRKNDKVTFVLFLTELRLYNSIPLILKHLCLDLLLVQYCNPVMVHAH